MSVHHPSTRAGGSNLLAVMALLVTWALVHASLVAFRDLPVFETGLLGPDAYMRMVRVVQLANDGAWFDGTIARANAPYGDTLHWTRPFDVLLILLAKPASFLLGSAQALHLAGIVVSPLLQLATGLLLIWALRPVIRPEVWFLPAIALFLQPCALAYSILGRADHHSLLLLVFVVVGGLMLRALRDPLDSRPALLAGIAAGFGIWLSVEFLLVVGLCLAAFGLPWLFGERERAAQGTWFSLGLSGIILLALFVERPLDRFLEPSYDSVSVVQYFLAVAVLLFWRGIETFENRRNRASRFFGRAMLGTLGCGAMLLLLGSAFPLFFAGPMAGVDPRILPIWLDRVQEMRPLIPQDRHTLGTFLFYLGGVALIMPFFLKILAEARTSGRFFTYLFIALACLLLSAAAVRNMRFSGYAEIAFVFAFAVVLDRFLRWTGRIGNDLLRGLLRGGFVGLMLLGPILVGGTLMTKDAVARDPAGQPLAGCKVREMAAYLESDLRWQAAPQTILAFMDIGPELLYRTRHRVIGTPYHRNGDGIYDGYRILATNDDAVAQSLIRQRGIDLVLLCQTPAERGFYAAPHGEENLYTRLNSGTPPDWLAPVALPEPLQSQAQLYRVLR
jgi:hypothetical protein